MNKYKKKICVITSGRADYGLLKNLIKKINASKKIDYHLSITGTHLSSKHGETFKEILSDKLKINSRVKIFENDKSSSIELGSILQSVKNGGSEGELFHLFGDPAMKLALSPNVISDAFVVPDTISTLETGKLSINSPTKSGSGSFVLQDADIEKVVSFFYGSR